MQNRSFLKSPRRERPIVSLRGGLNPSARLNGDLTPVQDSAAGGVFCREILTLEAGPHTVRLQVLLPARAGPQVLELTAAGEGGEVLARAVLDTTAPDALARADAITLSFVLEAPGVVEVEGTASAHARLTHLRFLTQQPVPRFEGHETAFNFFPGFDLPGVVPQTVILGTTAVCNANCFHCPTNKAYSKTQAKGFMPMALFERIIDQLAEIGFGGSILFGLFGDPLSDPLLLERVRMVRARLPGVIIHPSTNGAQYDPEKHREALSLVDNVAVHVEGVTPEVYNASMRPLKLARTDPRVERLIADRGAGMVHIVSPLHRRNLHEAAALRDLWEGRGADGTLFAVLMNRAGQADAFDDVALAPVATGCGPSIVTDLIIDWDGKVLTCCQDFHRRSIIGDLMTESVREVMGNAERQRVGELFNTKRWNALETCAGCKNDCQDAIDAIVSDRMKDSDARRRFPVRAFRSVGQVEAEGETLKVRTRRPWLDQLKARFKGAERATIYGPYRALHPGRYRLTFDLRDIRVEPRASLAFEIDTPSGPIAVRRLRGGGARRPEAIEIEVSAYVPLEFRVLARGMDFDFGGVSTERI